MTVDMLPTKADATQKLEAAFPGVPFRVVRCSYARGTNETKEFLEVSYNFKRFGDLDVTAVVPQAKVWAVGKVVA